MKKQLDAQKITLFLQMKAGRRPNSWKGERAFSASKMCTHCGEAFYPWMKVQENG